MVKYSFIVAMYNISKYIERCIDSLIKQTIDDYEIIVVNDGSTDDGLLKLNKYRDKIKIINKPNEGLSSARNKGMEFVTGEYCLFIDGDDYVDKNYLELFDNKIKENNDIDIWFAGFTMLNGMNKTYFIHSELNDVKDYHEIYKTMIGPSNKDKLNKRYTMSVWGKCYRTKFLKENNIYFKSEREFVSEDLVFHTDIYKFSPKISFIYNLGYVYVNNDYESLTKIFKEDRYIKEVKLHNYLVENTIHFSFEDKYRVYYNFLERIDGFIRQLILHNKKNSIVEIINIKEISFAAEFCEKFRTPIKAKLRIYYLKNKKIRLMFFVHKIRKK